jgi:hypothetical protein
VAGTGTEAEVSFIVDTTFPSIGSVALTLSGGGAYTAEPGLIKM